MEETTATTTTRKDELVELEEGFWTGDAAFYREHVDERCLIAFTEMAGMRSREEIAASVADMPRWREVEIDVRGIARPSDDVVLLTYDASARRGEGGETYAALVSSAYVRRGESWKLCFHQQTPR